MKKCTNCGRYPFCEEIQDIHNAEKCEKWIKREVEVRNVSN